MFYIVSTISLFMALSRPPHTLILSSHRGPLSPRTRSQAHHPTHNHKRPHVPAPPIPHYFSKLPDCHSISPLISFCFRYVPVFQYIRHSAHRQNSFLSSTLPLHPPTSPPSSYHYPIFASHPLGKPKPGNEQFAGSVLASMVSRCLSPRRDRLVMLILGE